MFTLTEVTFKNIGSKIRYFRKRSGLSQFDLEIEIGASSGSLSRIENGEINPTKETIAKIASSLRLNPSEVNYFLDIQYLGEEDKNIKAAINEVESTFSSIFNFSYLLDYKYRVISLSEGLEIIAKLVRIDTKKILNNYIAEIVFDPNFSLRQLIAPNEFDSVAIPVVSRMVHTRKHLSQENWYIELIEKLKQYSDFERIYKLVLENKIDMYNEESRTASINLIGKKIKVIYTFSQLLNDDRFTIIEFKFTNTSDLKIKKLLKSSNG